ncbi:Rrf2 family transcriptional regulator [Paraclostridium bifermentans]
MQLKFSTDYAIRIVLYLAAREEVVSLEKLAYDIGISQWYILKFCKILNASGIVNINDGFFLAKDPSQITMFDIIVAMENTIKINICLEENKYFACLERKSCRVRNFYFKLQNDIEASLKSITISELL